MGASNRRKTNPWTNPKQVCVAVAQLNDLSGSAVVEEGPWHGVQSEEEGELLKHGKQLTGLRRAAFDLVTWNKFDDIILGVIAINCISMAAYDPVRAQQGMG